MTLTSWVVMLSLVWFSCWPLIHILPLHFFAVGLFTRGWRCLGCLEIYSVASESYGFLVPRAHQHTMFISKWCKNINLGGCSGAWLPSALPSSDGCSFRASVLSTLKEIRPINLGNSGISSACWRFTSHTSDTDANVPWISLDHKFEVMDEIMFRSHLGSLPKTPNHQPFEPLIFQFPINFLGFYWWHGRWWCRLIREYRTSPGVWRSRVDWDCNAEINRNGICNKSIFFLYIKYSSTPSRMYIYIWYIYILFSYSNCLILQSCDNSPGAVLKLFSVTRYRLHVSLKT